MKILFTGDVMLGRLVNNVLNLTNYTYIWGDTLEIIRNADLSLINLECAISSKGKEWNKTIKAFHFRASPEAIEVLRTAHIDYVSLANNHVLDYDIEALFDTIDLLDKNRIAHSGAGRNLREAMEPAILNPKHKPMAYGTNNNTNSLRNIRNTNYIRKTGDINNRDNSVSEITNSKDHFDNRFMLSNKTHHNYENSNDNNIRIGIVSLTDNQPEWEACEQYPGINYIPINLSSSNKAYYYSRLRYAIENARRLSDIVIVSSHVGPHFRRAPSKEYSDFAHCVLDLGVDIYWGHSNHMPQGVEIYNDKKLIMYDCGDFVDDYAVDSDYRNDLSFIFLLHMEEDTCIAHSTAVTTNKSELDDNNSSELGKRARNVNDIEAKSKKAILKGTLELIPTKISEFRVNTASLEDADLAINRMVDRCNYLGTKCSVDNLRKRITIKI
jgi:poly-gamma-glutamate capsule biosynthesis protein CapA/YwtB (metallophosphatase superfamily)